jgi:single-strand DNA-binding protein
MYSIRKRDTGSLLGTFKRKITMNFSQTIIIGRLAHTPILKQTNTDMKVTTFSMATNRTWKNRDGEKQEETEWHNCVAYGKTAEVLAEFTEGGQELQIVGRNKTSNWEKDGVKFYKTEIIVESFQFGERSKSRAERKEKEQDERVQDTIEKAEEDAGAVDFKDFEKKSSRTDAIDYPSASDLDVNIDDIPFN